MAPLMPITRSCVVAWQVSLVASLSYILLIIIGSFRSCKIPCLTQQGSCRRQYQDSSQHLSPIRHSKSLPWHELCYFAWGFGPVIIFRCLWQADWILQKGRQCFIGWFITCRRSGRTEHMGNNLPDWLREDLDTNRLIIKPAIQVISGMCCVGI